jgi:hypothetical protein
VAVAGALVDTHRFWLRRQNWCEPLLTSFVEVHRSAPISSVSAGIRVALAWMIQVPFLLGGGGDICKEGNQSAVKKPNGGTFLSVMSYHNTPSWFNSWAGYLMGMQIAAFVVA